MRVSSTFGGDGGAGVEGAPFPKSNLSKDEFRILKHTKDQTRLSERIIREKSRWVDFSCGLALVWSLPQMVSFMMN